MNSPFRYPGSKNRLAPWIISHFPRFRSYTRYCEPFVGSGAVLFNLPSLPAEVVVNDAATDIATLWRVMRDEPVELARQLTLSPFSRQEYILSGSSSREGLTDIEIARRLLVLFRQGRTNRLNDAPTSWRFQRKDGDRSHQLSNHHRFWLKLPEVVLEAHSFFSNVILEVENGDAAILMERYDRPDTLFYVDPPYVSGTRSKQSVEYWCEMDEAQHVSMLKCLKALKGFVVLSGYNHPLYRDMLSEWETIERVVQDDGGNARTEKLWLSPSVTANREFNHPLLFDEAA